MSRVLVFAIPFASACAYAPGSFSSYPSSFPGTRSTVGCLDVATALTSTNPLGSVVQYTVGNRCDQVTVVDFSAVRVRSGSGVNLGASMVPYDPKRELRPLRIEARTVITEQIEYRHAVPSAGQALCVDVAALNGPSMAERWSCQESGPPRSPQNPSVADSVGGAP